MPYKSPYLLLSYFGDNTITTSPEDLKRLQQKFMAEFNLPGNSALQINGQSYTKDDILKAIEALRNLSQNPLHQKIAAYKNILLFLSNPGSASPLNDIKLFSLQIAQEPESDEWQKLLSAALSAHFSVSISNQKYASCTGSLQLLLCLNTIGCQEVYDEIRKSLQAYQTSLLAKIQGPQIKLLSLARVMTEFNFIEAQNFPAFLNRLPPDFSELKSGIVKNLASYFLSHIQLRFRTRDFLINNTTALLGVSGLNPDTIERLTYLKKEAETFSAEKTGKPGGLLGGTTNDPIHSLLFRYINLINQVYNYISKVKTVETKKNRFFYFLRIFSVIMLVLYGIILVDSIAHQNLKSFMKMDYIIGSLIFLLIVLFVPRQGKTKKGREGKM